METPEFIRVLQHFTGTSTKDAENVLTLKENFPFSQILHTLSARVSKDHGFSNSQRELQLAAVYAADRGVLKDIMEAYDDERDDAETLNPQGITSKSTVDIAETLIQDMERLHMLRQNFELLFVDVAATSFQTEPPVLPENESHKKKDEVQAIEEVPAQKELLKSKKERIIELAKTISPQESAIEHQIKGRRRRKDPVEVILDQIATSKEEITPESEKQKEQIELIDHFIKAQPSISGTKDKQIVPDDLSSIKTGEFGEAIISETLVEILLKQGKKDKAVEVLKKLIWKFPQKKAYFATQIEELRK